MGRKRVFDIFVGPNREYVVGMGLLDGCTGPPIVENYVVLDKDYNLLDVSCGEDDVRDMLSISGPTTSRTYANLRHGPKFQNVGEDDDSHAKSVLHILSDYTIWGFTKIRGDFLILVLGDNPTMWRRHRGRLDVEPCGCVKVKYHLLV